MLTKRPFKIREITLTLLLDNPTVYSDGGNLSLTFRHLDGSQTPDSLTLTSTMGNQPSLAVTTDFVLEQVPREIW